VYDLPQAEGKHWMRQGENCRRVREVYFEGPKPG
jgi:hypothetical protein